MPAFLSSNVEMVKNGWFVPAHYAETRLLTDILSGMPHFVLAIRLIYRKIALQLSKG